MLFSLKSVDSISAINNRKAFSSMRACEWARHDVLAPKKYVA